MTQDRDVEKRASLAVTILAVMLAGALLGGCRPMPEVPEEGERPELRIGLIIEGSTPRGPSALDAALLAVEHLRVDETLPRIHLVTRTDSTTPQGTTLAARQLIYQEDVQVLVGPLLSRNAIRVADVAENARIPMISPGSTHPATTAGRRYVFRVPFDDNFQGAVLARFAAEDLGLRTTAVLYDVSDAYSQGLAESFRDAFQDTGGRIPAFEAYTLGEQDFRPQLQKIHEQRCEALFLPNANTELRVQLTQVHQLGLNVTLLGSDIWTSDLLASTFALDGSYFTDHWHNDLARTNPEAQVFLSAFSERYERSPYSMAALTWDALGVAAAAAQAGIQPESIRDHLAAMEGFRGATGEISYRGRGGNPFKSALILKIEGQEVLLHGLGQP
jgi:branched-chain amino acid transport system substrate-binding protein